MGHSLASPEPDYGPGKDDFRDKEPCELFDVQTGRLCSAELLKRIYREDLVETTSLWDEAKLRYKSETDPSQEIPENDDWNWQRKFQVATSGDYAFLGVRCRSEMQGLIQLSLVPRFSRRPGRHDQGLFYVEYLETAPWNQKRYVGENLRFKRVGTILLQAAQKISIDAGCDGRLALHTLKSANSFYIARGFRDLGLDLEAGYNWLEQAGVEEAAAKE